MKRFTLRISDELYEEIVVEAKHDERSVNAWIERALRWRMLIPSSPKGWGDKPDPEPTPPNQPITNAEVEKASPRFERLSPEEFNQRFAYAHTNPGVAYELGRYDERLARHCSEEREVKANATQDA